MNKKIKIILAEDQELFRKSLIALLKSKSSYEVVGETCNGKELIDLLKYKNTDVVLLDADMPIMDGKVALEIIKKRFPDIKIIILGSCCEMLLVSYFMTHGANSYLSKDCSVQTLFNAVETVMSDGYFFDHSTSRALLDTVMKEKNLNSEYAPVSFNERETEIVRRVCDGQTNKEIAQALHISTSTVDFHKNKIYSKVKCNNATQLLKYALKRGLIALS